MVPVVATEGESARDTHVNDNARTSVTAVGDFKGMRPRIIYSFNVEFFLQQCTILM
jgi:hypothetical protein